MTHHFLWTIDLSPYLILSQRSWNVVCWIIATHSSHHSSTISSTNSWRVDQQWHNYCRSITTSGKQTDAIYSDHLLLLKLESYGISSADKHKRVALELRVPSPTGSPSPLASHRDPSSGPLCSSSMATICLTTCRMTPKFLCSPMTRNYTGL